MSPDSHTPELELSDDSVLSVPEPVLSRTVEGETVLLDLDSELYYGLEGAGTRFWELVAAGTTFGEAIETMLGEFDVDPDVLVADITAIVAELRSKGLILVHAP